MRQHGAELADADPARGPSSPGAEAGSAAAGGVERVDDHEQVVGELLDLGQVRRLVRLAARLGDVLQRQGVDGKNFSKTSSSSSAVGFSRSIQSTSGIALGAGNCSGLQSSPCRSSRLQV